MMKTNYFKIKYNVKLIIIEILPRVITYIHPHDDGSTCYHWVAEEIVHLIKLQNGRKVEKIIRIECEKIIVIKLSTVFLL